MPASCRMSAKRRRYAARWKGRSRPIAPPPPCTCTATATCSSTALPRPPLPPRRWRAAHERRTRGAARGERRTRPHRVGGRRSHAGRPRGRRAGAVGGTGAGRHTGEWLPGPRRERRGIYAGNDHRTRAIAVGGGRDGLLPHDYHRAGSAHHGTARGYRGGAGARPARRALHPVRACGGAAHRPGGRPTRGAPRRACPPARPRGVRPLAGGGRGGGAALHVPRQRGARDPAAPPGTRRVQASG